MQSSSIKSIHSYLTLDALACWISSLLQIFEGSSVTEMLTSLVATQSTDMPRSSNIENTCSSAHTHSEYKSVSSHTDQTEFLAGSTYLRQETKLTQHPSARYIQHSDIWLQHYTSQHSLCGEKKRNQCLESNVVLMWKHALINLPQTWSISLCLVIRVPGALGLYEFLTLTGISPSLAGLIDCGCKTCLEHNNVKNMSLSLKNTRKKSHLNNKSNLCFFKMLKRFAIFIIKKRKGSCTTDRTR